MSISMSSMVGLPKKGVVLSENDQNPMPITIIIDMISCKRYKYTIKAFKKFMMLLNLTHIMAVVLSELAQQLN